MSRKLAAAWVASFFREPLTVAQLCHLADLALAVWDVLEDE